MLLTSTNAEPQKPSEVITRRHKWSLVAGDIARISHDVRSAGAPGEHSRSGCCPPQARHRAGHARRAGRRRRGDAEAAPTHGVAAHLVRAALRRAGRVAPPRLDLTNDVIKVRRAVTFTPNATTVGPPKTDAGIRDVAVPPHPDRDTQCALPVGDVAEGGLRCPCEVVVDGFSGEFGLADAAARAAWRSRPWGSRGSQSRWSPRGSLSPIRPVSAASRGRPPLRPWRAAMSRAMAWGLGLGQPLALEVDDLGVEVDVLDAVDVGGVCRHPAGSSWAAPPQHRGARVSTPGPRRQAWPAASGGT